MVENVQNFQQKVIHSKSAKCCCNLVQQNYLFAEDLQKKLHENIGNWYRYFKLNKKFNRLRNAIHFAILNFVLNTTSSESYHIYRTQE